MTSKSALEERLAPLVARALAALPAGREVCVAVHAERRAASISGESGAALRASPGAPFRIASITKPFVAATVHRLAAAGRLSPWATIRSSIAPATATLLAGHGYDPDAITIAQLLSHTSGLCDHTLLPEYTAAVLAAPQRRWSRAEQIRLACERGRPVAAPGAVYQYSDTGYVLLGEIVERAADRPLASAVRATVDFDALGLAATWWESLEPPGVSTPLAHQYRGDVDISAYDPSFDLHGGGGLVSTVDDLARFVRELVLGRVLERRTLAAALMAPAAARPADAPARTHGYLLATFTSAGRSVLGHTGHWNSVMLCSPADQVAVAATLNDDAAELRPVLDELAAAALRVAVEDA